MPWEMYAQSAACWAFSEEVRLVMMEKDELEEQIRELQDELKRRFG